MNEYNKIFHVLILHICSIDKVIMIIDPAEKCLAAKRISFDLSLFNINIMPIHLRLFFLLNKQPNAGESSQSQNLVVLRAKY